MISSNPNNLFDNVCVTATLNSPAIESLDIVLLYDQNITIVYVMGEVKDKFDYLPLTIGLVRDVKYK